MPQGTVKFFVESKGFGFITDSESGEDIFVHVSEISQELREGDNVRFEVKDGKKGLNATNVELI